MQILVKPVMLDNDDEEQEVVAYCDLTCNCNDKSGGGNHCTNHTGDDEVDDILF